MKAEPIGGVWWKFDGSQLLSVWPSTELRAGIAEMAEGEVDLISPGPPSETRRKGHCPACLERKCDSKCDCECHRGVLDKPIKPSPAIVNDAVNALLEGRDADASRLMAQYRATWPVPEIDPEQQEVDRAVFEASEDKFCSNCGATHRGPWDIRCDVIRCRAAADAEKAEAIRDERDREEAVRLVNEQKRRGGPGRRRKWASDAARMRAVRRAKRVLEIINEQRPNRGEPRELKLDSPNRGAYLTGAPRGFGLPVQLRVLFEKEFANESDGGCLQYGRKATAANFVPGYFIRGLPKSGLVFSAGHAPQFGDHGESPGPDSDPEPTADSWKELWYCVKNYLEKKAWRRALTVPEIAYVLHTDAYTVRRLRDAGTWKVLVKGVSHGKEKVRKD